MRARIKPTYANVMSTIAVFGVLAGGGAYAASQIGPRDIGPNAVRAKHIKKGQVRAKHIKKGQVRAKHVAPNSIGTPSILDGSVTAAKLADGVQGLRGPQGPPGPRGEPGLPGERGPAGPVEVVVRRSGFLVIEPGGIRQAEVSCAPGEKATGGGIVAGNGFVVDLVAVKSEAIGGSPTSPPTGWRAQARNADANNDGKDTIEVRAEVVCVR